MENRRGKSIRFAKYLLVLVVLGAGLYWIRFAPLNVSGVRLSRGDVVAEVMGSGTLEARVQTVVSSKIPGRIIEIRADQGDLVREGDVLARLDDQELKQQVEIARSALSAAQAAIDRVQAEAARFQAVTEQVKSEYDRQQKLFVSKAISPNEYEKARQARAVAEADTARSKAAVIEARKNLLVAENTLAYQVARLHDTVITAPFPGLIVRRDREPGDVVVPGTSMFLIISMERLWVRAWVDETEMSGVSVGQSARVLFRSEPERAFPGKVARLGRETDRETRQFIVDVEVENLPRNWAVGQRSDVFIRTAERKGVLLLPARLVARRGGRPGVFVARDGRAEWSPIQPGLSGRETVEVQKGLTEGDTVIAPPDSKRFVEGRRVRVAYHESGP